MDTCLHCKENITEEEKEFGQQINLITENGIKKPWVHRECQLYQIVGSVNHQQGKCLCYSKENNETDSGLSFREEAKVAVEYFEINSHSLVDRLSDVANK